jgi:hypothetical protein
VADDVFLFVDKGSLVTQKGGRYRPPWLGQADCALAYAPTE